MRIPTIIGQPAALRYSSSYSSNANMAANTPATVFAPGSNPNGAWLWRAGFTHVNAAGSGFSIINKASAPTTIVDGDVIAIPDLYAAIGAANLYTGSIKEPIFIPPGRGLYFISTNAETAAQRFALYGLL